MALFAVFQIARSQPMFDSCQLQQAAEKISNGAIIAYPTEAVWGLGCDPWNEKTVRRLLQLKQRSAEKGLILVAAQIEQFAPLLDGLPAEALAQLQQSWPGPVTWLVPHHQQLPSWITGSHPNVALRVSAHPLIQALCRLTGPLVSTSANPAAYPAATSRQQLEQYFHGQIDMVIDAELGQHTQPSTIRELLTGKILRP